MRPAGFKIQLVLLALLVIPGLAVAESFSAGSTYQTAPCQGVTASTPTLYSQDTTSGTVISTWQDGNLVVRNTSTGRYMIINPDRGSLVTGTGLPSSTSGERRLLFPTDSTDCFLDYKKMESSAPNRLLTTETPILYETYSRQPTAPCN